MMNINEIVKIKSKKSALTEDFKPGYRIHFYHKRQNIEIKNHDIYEEIGKLLTQHSTGEFDVPENFGKLYTVCIGKIEDAIDEIALGNLSERAYYINIGENLVDLLNE